MYATESLFTSRPRDRKLSMSPNGGAAGAAPRLFAVALTLLVLILQSPFSDPLSGHANPNDRFGGGRREQNPAHHSAASASSSSFAAQSQQTTPAARGWQASNPDLQAASWSV
jgi:hypothetical protein